MVTLKQQKARYRLTGYLSEEQLTLLGKWLAANGVKLSITNKLDVRHELVVNWSMPVTKTQPSAHFGRHVYLCVLKSIETLAREAGEPE